MRPVHYRMQHPAIDCRACLSLHGKPVPGEARQWLKPTLGHAMFLTSHGRMRACDLGAAATVRTDTGIRDAARDEYED